MDELRVLVVADDPLARAGLAALLDGPPECRVVGQLVAGEDLANEVALYRPDVVLWDLGWDPAPNIELVEQLELSLTTVALLPDEIYAVDVWMAGVRGLLLRETKAEPLVAALQAVDQGLVAVDQVLASVIFPARDEAAETLAEELTPRELEVLQLLAEGLSNRAIGQELGISAHTVKFHVTAIMGKLGAQSRTEAVVRATRLGLIIL